MIYLLAPPPSHIHQSGRAAQQRAASLVDKQTGACPILAPNSSWLLHVHALSVHGVCSRVLPRTVERRPGELYRYVSRTTRSSRYPTWWTGCGRVLCFWVFLRWLHHEFLSFSFFPLCPPVGRGHSLLSWCQSFSAHSGHLRLCGCKWHVWHCYTDCTGYLDVIVEPYSSPPPLFLSYW